MWGSGSHDPGSNPGGTTNYLVPRRVEFVDQRVLVFDPAGREYATSMSVGPEPDSLQLNGQLAYPCIQVIALLQQRLQLREPPLPTGLTELRLVVVCEVGPVRDLRGGVGQERGHFLYRTAVVIYPPRPDLPEIMDSVVVPWCRRPQAGEHHGALDESV